MDIIRDKITSTLNSMYIAVREKKSTDNYGVFINEKKKFNKSINQHCLH